MTDRGSDATYQTLRRLLLAPPANRPHLDMMDGNALYGAMGHYLAAMALVNVTEFAHVLATSPALWAPRGDALIERASGTSQALAFAVSERVRIITEALARSAPRTAPAELGAWLRAVLDGARSADMTTGRARLACLSLVTGLLRGIATQRSQRHVGDSLRARLVAFGLRRHARRLEAEWGHAAAAFFNQAHSDDEKLAGLALAAHAIDLVPEAQRQAVADHVWIDTAVPALLRTFRLDQAQFPAEVRNGIVHVLPGSTWAADVLADPLYPLAGPISRVANSALRHLGLCSSAEAFAEACKRDTVPSLLAAVTALDDAWSSSALAGTDEAQIDVTSRPATTDTWRLLKTVLFAVTMVLDAVVGAVVELCPSPPKTYPPSATVAQDLPPMATSNTPAPYLTLVSDALTVYAHLYFITCSFGLDGFESYRLVFYSALDVLACDAAASAQLVLRFADALTERHGVLGHRAAASVSFSERIHATYVLLVVEQLVAELPDVLVDRIVLPLCCPYLTDTRYQDAFESAHSVLLAMYKAQSPATLELTPFYTDLLLRCYPAQLSAEQLEVALSTVVASLSDRSDSFAWWVIERLDAAVTRARAVGDDDKRATLTACLAALISHVNLVLLRALLTKVAARIYALPEASAPRVALTERVFAALTDLDAATREEAMRWWLDQAPSFARGM